MLELELELTLRDFDLAIAFRTGARSLALFGPSGCGKSTTLLALAGLRRPHAGRIVLDGRVLFDAAAHVDVAPATRRLGVVFQEGRLFPHLDVRANLAYGCHRDGAGPNFDTVVELLGLGGLLRRATLSLSGGEARRVAVGRALLSNPVALLLDEPLVGLHREARAQVLAYLVQLQRELHLPTVLVSHQPDEVIALAEDVVRLDDGRVVEQIDAAGFGKRFAAG